MASNGEILSERAGRLITKHAMYWERRLRTSLAEVWNLVSTKEGLETWWIVPPGVLDLRVGGDFKHHWHQTVASFEDHRYIDFVEPLASCRGTGGMRFELKALAPRETMFLFLDTCGADLSASATKTEMYPPHEAKPGDPGTVCPSIAAGWHRMLDGLANHCGDDLPSYNDQELSSFYMHYLEDQFRLYDMVQTRPNDGIS